MELQHNSLLPSLLRGAADELQQLRRTDEGDGQQRKRQKVGRLARQSGRVSDTEHQPENITDAP